jgi:hypothetical protein
MPGRSTQQNLRNFVLRPEPLAVVNAERLFGNMKIGRSGHAPLFRSAALGQTPTSQRGCGMSVLPLTNGQRRSEKCQPVTAASRFELAELFTGLLQSRQGAKPGRR